MDKFKLKNKSYSIFFIIYLHTLLEIVSGIKKVTIPSGITKTTTTTTTCADLIEL